MVERRQADIAMTHRALNLEAEAFGGWHGWQAALAPTYKRWQDHLESAPDVGKGVIAGKDGFFFFRNWESYVLEASYLRDGGEQAGDALHTLVSLNQQFQERDIHFIVVPVPSRSEIYPEMLLPGPSPERPIAPPRKQFIAALLEHDVESIDLLPALSAAKAIKSVSLPNDTHWSPYGAEIAAEVIAKRLSRYDWEDLYGRPATPYARATVPYGRSWALFDRLSPEHQRLHPPTLVEVNQIRLPNAQPYAPAPTAPLLITGDSFLFFYAAVQADVAAHIAHHLGYPVATKPMGGGQAARVARSFARMPSEELTPVKVVVFIFLGPYLRYDNWHPAPLPAKKEGSHHDK